MRSCLVFLLVVVVTCASARQTDPQSKGEITLRNAEYAFTISIPDKWNLDTAGRALRFAARAVLYAPALGSGHCMIEVLPATKSIEGKNTLANLLSYAVHLDSTHGARHIENSSLRTRDGKKATVITSAYKDWQSVDAYIDDINAVIVLSLYVPDLQVREEALAALTATVQSYSSLPVGSATKQ
jgi:hypothetical protein